MRQGSPEFERLAAESTLIPKYVLEIDFGGEFPPEESENLLLYSGELENAWWSKGTGLVLTPEDALAPDGTLTAYLLEDPGSQYSQLLNTTLPFDETKRLMLSIYVRKDAVPKETRYASIYLQYRNTAGTNNETNYLKFDTSTGEFEYVVTTAGLGVVDVNGGGGVEDAGDFWRVWVGAIAGPDCVDLMRMSIFPAHGYHTGATWLNNAARTGSIHVAWPQLVEGLDLLTYLETGSSALVFPSPIYDPDYYDYTENLFLHSQDFTNLTSWTNDGSVPTRAGDVAFAPDGTFTADTITDTGAIIRGIRQTVLGLDITRKYTASLYIAKDNVPSTTRYPLFQFTYSTNTNEAHQLFIDTSTGDFTFDAWVGSDGSASVVSYGEYWRVDISATSVDPLNDTFYLIIKPAYGAGAIPNEANGDSGASGTITLWGAQLVGGPKTLPYLPTTTVSRSDYVFATNVHYLTSEGAKVPVDTRADRIVAGSMLPKGISGQTQKISPDKAQHTIGNVVIKALDIDQLISTMIYTRLQSDIGLRQRVVRMYKGWEGLETFDDYSLIFTYLIDGVSYMDGIYTFNCSDVQRTSKIDIFKLHEGNLTSTISDVATEIPITIPDAGNKFPLLEHDLNYSDNPKAIYTIEQDISDVSWTKSNCTVTVDQVPGPEGGANTADKIIDAGALTLCQIAYSYDTGSPLASRTITMRVWLRTDVGQTEMLDVDFGLKLFDTTAENEFFEAVRITTEWQQFSITGDFPIGETDTEVHFQIVSPFIATTDDYYYVGGVELFEPRLVGYIKIEDEIICHGGWNVGNTALGVIDRGALGTLAATHTVTESETSKKESVYEYVYIEMNVPRLIYSILTGVIPNQSGGMPSHWNLQIPETFVRLSDFQNIGADLWDPVNDRGRMALLDGVSQEQGKAFIEKELLLWIGAFMPVYSSGEYGIKRFGGVLPKSAHTAVLGVDDIKRYQELVFHQKSLINNIRIAWNWIDALEKFTKNTQLIDATSIYRYKLAPTKNYAFRGVKTGVHTDQDIANYFNAIRDRYGSPPKLLKVNAMPKWDLLEVGDIIRLNLPQIWDSDLNEPLDRALEVQQSSVNWLTGETLLALFGGIQASSREAVTANTVLDDTFFTTLAAADGGIELSTVLTIVSGAVTLNGTLTGAARHKDAIYYYDGDLVINANIDVDWTHNIQFRISGTLTVYGTFTSIGGGTAGGAGSPNIVSQIRSRLGDTIYPWASRGSGVFGKTYVCLTSHHYDYGSRNVVWNGLYGAPRIWQFNAQFNRFLWEIDRDAYFASGEFDELPEPALINPDGFSVEGLLDDYRGVSGCGGQASIHYEELGGDRLYVAPIVAGQDGAAGGGGLVFIGRGLFFGASGSINTSGGDGIVASSAADHGETFYGGSGGPGYPGAVQVLIDGTASTPNRNKFIAKTGAYAAPPANYLFPNPQLQFRELSAGSSWGSGYYGNNVAWGGDDEQKDGLLRISYVPAVND